MSNNKRLRRLVRNLIKDRCWVEITDWYWKDFQNKIHIEPVVDIISLCADYCWYTMRRYKSSEYTKKLGIKTECYEHLTIGAADCLCYNLIIEDIYSITRNGTDIDYTLKYKSHEIRIRRLTKQECLDKKLIKENEK